MTRQEEQQGQRRATRCQLAGTAAPAQCKVQAGQKVHGSNEQCHRLSDAGLHSQCRGA